MDSLDILLLALTGILGYQLFLAKTQGRIYGKNNWYTYSAGWICAEQQSCLFYATVTTYWIGLIGAILIFALKLVQ